MNKTTSYIKNVAIATSVAMVAGVGAAELADLVSDSENVISVTSTIADYVGWYAAFLPLHARDNQEIYRDDQGFKWKEFTKDQLKFAAAFLVLDVAYLGGRPFVIKEFLESGYRAGYASGYTDAILTPLMLAASIPIAKISGIIRSNDE